MSVRPQLLDLPTPLLLQICSFLDAHDHIALEQTCTTLRDASNDVWRTRVRADLPHGMQVYNNPSTSLSCESDRAHWRRVYHSLSRPIIITYSFLWKGRAFYTPTPPAPLTHLAGSRRDDLLALDVRGNLHVLSPGPWAPNAWVPITLPPPARVRQISTALDTYLVLDTHGTVWLYDRAWRNAPGRLPASPTHQVTNPQPPDQAGAASPPPSLFPLLVKLFPSHTDIIHVSAGTNSAAVLSRSGAVFLWPAFVPLDQYSADQVYEYQGPPLPPVRLPPAPGGRGRQVAVWTGPESHCNSRGGPCVVGLLADDGDVWIWHGTQEAYTSSNRDGGGRDGQEYQEAGGTWTRLAPLCDAGNSQIAVWSTQWVEFQRIESQGSMFVLVLPGPRIVRLERGRPESGGGDAPKCTAPLEILGEGARAGLSFTSIVNHDADGHGYSPLLLTDSGEVYWVVDQKTGASAVLHKLKMSPIAYVLSATHQMLLVAGEVRGLTC